MRKMKYFACCGALALTLTVGCTGNSGDDKPEASPTAAEATAAPETTETPEATATPEPTATLTPQEAEDLKYQAMIEDSLIASGNNYRLKKVMERAKAGEDIYIATIGGSITEGEGASNYLECYAMQTYLNFAKDYGAGDGSNVHFINAGISGTPSTLGVLRYQRDVIDKNGGHKPDLVIVEFAVNDGDDPTNGGTYEGLVRHILQDDNQPAVILLFSVFQSKWNLQDRLIPIGKYYDLPMVSIKNAVVPRLNDGTVAEAKFFNDAYHPKSYGHTIMADCLRHLFRTVEEQEAAAEDIVIPETAKISNLYDNVEMIASDTADASITLGSFSAVDGVLGTIRYDKTKTFPNNWKHAKDAGNDPFVLTVSGKSLLMTYKKSSSQSFGSIDVYVDGQKTKTISGYDQGGWNNPYTVVIFEDSEAKEHKVEIKMAEGSEDKEFSILAFGCGK